MLVGLFVQSCFPWLGPMSSLSLLLSSVTWRELGEERQREGTGEVYSTSERLENKPLGPKEREGSLPSQTVPWGYCVSKSNNQIHSLSTHFSEVPLFEKLFL